MGAFAGTCAMPPCSKGGAPDGLGRELLLKVRKPPSLTRRAMSLKGHKQPLRGLIDVVTFVL